MKLLSKVGVALSIMAMVVFASCEVNIGGGNDDPPAGGAIPGVSFESYNVNAAFFVDNWSQYRLVAFKGSLHIDNLLGGIPAGAEYHGIRRNPALFNRTEAFPVIIITDEQFIANRNNLSALNNTPFTRMFVFYNHGLQNPARLEISGRLGGRHRLLVQNPTGFDVELRYDGGRTIGFAPRQMLATTLYLTDGDVNIFPVARFFNPVHQIVTTVHPRAPAGHNWFMPLLVGGAGPPQSLTLNLQQAFAGVNEMTLGAAWMVFVNSSATTIGIEHGATLVECTIGFNYINTGSRRVIPIEMPSVGGDAFANQLTVGGFRVGPFGFRVDVTDGNGSTSFTLQADMQYTVTITGDFHLGTLAAVIDLENPVRVNIRDILDD